MTVSELLDRIPDDTTLSFYYEDKDDFDLKSYIHPIKQNLVTFDMPRGYICLSKTFIDLEVKTIIPIERGHLSVEVYNYGLIH